MSPIPTSVEFIGFGAVEAIDVSYRVQQIDTGLDYQFPVTVEGAKEIEVVVVGDFGHREIPGLLYGKPGIFHKVRTKEIDGGCQTLFSFEERELPEMEKR